MSRLLGMGSTDIVEVAGLAPWQGAGPWRVWNEKTGVTVAQEQPETPEQAWGHVMESCLRDWYAQQIGRPIARCARVMRTPDDFFWATPDGRDDEGHFYEIKNVGAFMAGHWDRADDDGIPHYVRGQVTIGMYCANVQHWTVIACIGGLPPRVYRVEYDEVLAERLIEIGRAFWDRVVAKEPPEVDGSDECRAYLSSKWPRDTRPVRESTYDEDTIGMKRIEAAILVREQSALVKLADAQLLAACGDHKAIVGDGWKLSTFVDKKTGQRRTRFTVKGEADE
jgi:putative phage-type endonuclease